MIVFPVRLRYGQMKQASVMKYGEEVHGEIIEGVNMIQYI